MCLTQCTLKSADGVSVPLNEVSKNALDLFVADVMFNTVVSALKTNSTLFIIGKHQLHLPSREIIPQKGGVSYVKHSDN